MKSTLIAFLFLVLVACGKTNDHSSHHDDAQAGENPNAALSDEVDQIHMDVMGKMDEVYSLKGKLSEKVNDPAVAEGTKTEIRGVILQLDSADKIMMDFMHQPQLADSTDAEKAREFYETEIETIKKIRDFFDETLAKAKAVADKK